jgi:GNAT superfamily N-acetyltransferase
MDDCAMPERESGVRRPRPPDPAAFSIRLATKGELGGVAALFAPALEPYRGSGSDSILDAYLLDLLDVRSRFEAAETYVAVQDERIVGSVAFYPDVVLEGWSTFPAGWAGFRSLAVDPRARGAGVGRALVERCLQRAREVGAPTLGIHTVALLVDAVRLYGRLGFSRCPEFDLHAADVFPADGADDITGLAFRYDWDRTFREAGQTTGPRTVIDPGVTT